MDLKKALTDLADLEDQKAALSEVIVEIDSVVETLSDYKDFTLPENVEPEKPTPTAIEPRYEEVSYETYMIEHHPFRTLGPLFIVFLFSVIWIARTGTVSHPRVNTFLIIFSAVIWSAVISSLFLGGKLLFEYFVSDRYYREEWARFCENEKRKAYETAKAEAARLDSLNWAEYERMKKACDLLYVDRVMVLKEDLERELCRTIKNKLQTQSLSQMKDALLGIIDEITEELREGYRTLNIPPRYQNSIAVHFLAGTDCPVEEGCARYDVYQGSPEAEQLENEIKLTVADLTAMAMGEILRASKNSIPPGLRDAEQVYLLDCPEMR